MANILIKSIAIQNDDTTVFGTVDAVETQGHTWLSHLYPPKSQDPKSSAQGCQNDTDRLNHLYDVLSASAGIKQQQKLPDAILQTLEVLIAKQPPPPIEIDPTIAQVALPLTLKGQ